MPALVETMVSAGNEVPWHGEGVVLPQERLSGDEVLHYGGLDWEVELEPISIRGKEDPDFRATVRQTDGQRLGIVSKSYPIFQNREAVAALDALVELDAAQYVTAGSLKGGKVIWALMQPPTDIWIAGEQHKPFLFGTWTHDKSGSFRIRDVLTRVVCWNTHTAALAEKGSREIIVRHTSKIELRIKEARRILGLADQTWQAMADHAEKLALRKFEDHKLDAFLESLFPVAVDTELAKLIAGHKRDTVRDIYLTASNLDGIRGTNWGVYNAVVEWHDHGIQRRDTPQTSASENRLTAIMTDRGSVRPRALALLSGK